MDELLAFFEKYMAAVNARDEDAFDACFHPPVVAMMAPAHDEQGVGQSLLTISEPKILLNLLPEHWSRSTVDSVVALDAAVPFSDQALLEGPELYRRGLVTTFTRWNREGRAYERLQFLYLLTRQDGGLGIKLASELAKVSLRG